MYISWNVFLSSPESPNVTAASNVPEVMDMEIHSPSVSRDEEMSTDVDGKLLSLS